VLSGMRVVTLRTLSSAHPARTGQEARTAGRLEAQQQRPAAGPVLVTRHSGATDASECTAPPGCYRDTSTLSLELCPAVIGYKVYDKAMPEAYGSFGTYRCGPATQRWQQLGVLQACS
jgi:hypothetical protein